MQHNPDIRVLCSHIFPATPAAAEHPCHSPALRGESFCFYHHPSRQSTPTRAQRRAEVRARRSFTPPLPTNPDGRPLSLSEIATRLAANQIDLHHAAQLLAALDAASRSLVPPIESPSLPGVSFCASPARSFP